MLESLKDMSTNGHEPQTLVEELLGKKFLFAGVFTLVLFVTVVALDTIGLAPRGVSSTTPLSISTTTRQSQVMLQEGQGEAPVRIEIPKIGIQTRVNNPAQSDIATLDAALLSGAVRYPGSALSGEEGNVLIFGHSSQLPVVYNQAFKAFNDIQKLENGDPIYVIGEENVFIYAVDNVYEANTNTDAIPLEVDGARLTLATCNNFGSKEDRFIVTAKLVNIQKLPEGA